MCLLSFGAQFFSAGLLYFGNGVRGDPSADLRVSQAEFSTMGEGRATLQ